MHEWIRSFSSFAEMMTSSIMPSDGTASFYFHAIALTVIALAARIASKKDDSFFQRFLAKASKGTLAKGQKVALSALKACPKCAEQLPLSTLVCETCDYNFLSRSVGHRHKLLPAPEVAASNG
jgi:hypothetical protein